MTDKETFRRDYRRRRRELSAEQRAAQSAALTGHCLELIDRLRQDHTEQTPFHSRVASVMSYGAEPDTAELHERLAADQVEVLVPVNLPQRQLGWVRWYPGVPMERSTVAPIDEPVGPRQPVSAMAEVDVVFVPAQAVDAAGYRMGQGGGYYDRFLAALEEQVDTGAMERRPLTVAVVFDHEFVERLPRDELDRPTDAVLTPDGLHWSVRPAP